MVLIMKNDENNYNNFYDDTTKYGEFVSSYFAWVSLPQQKKNVERLENITNSKNNKK